MISTGFSHWVYITDCVFATFLSSLLYRYQGVERGVQAFYKPSSTPSVHCFLGAVELERPLASLWSMVRDHSKTHLYHKAIHSARTRPLDDSTQLGESAGWSIAGLRSILYLKMVKAFNAAAHAKTRLFWQMHHLSMSESFHFSSDKLLPGSKVKFRFQL